MLFKTYGICYLLNTHTRLYRKTTISILGGLPQHTLADYSSGQYLMCFGGNKDTCGVHNKNIAENSS